MAKRALVTGGAGFIGSNLTSYLLNDGWEVIIYDNLSRKGSEKNLVWLLENNRTPKLKVNINDVRDYPELLRTVSKVDVIYHLAAQVAVTTSFLNPREDFEINALGSFNVLEAARLAGHKPIIIFASTNKVYGQMDNVKVNGEKLRYSYTKYKKGISEDFQLDFHSPYGCSNGVADQYTRDYFRMYGIPTVVFRQSCIYGPRQLGVEDQGWVAHFAVAANLNKPITIYGDGKQVRDLLYIDDLIQAYQMAIANIQKTAGEVYNIGGGLDHSFSLLEYIRYLQNLVGKKIEVKFAPWRPGDQKIYTSNNSKIEKALGWKVKICHKEGLRKLYEWAKENRQIFN